MFWWLWAPFSSPHLLLPACLQPPLHNYVWYFPVCPAWGGGLYGAMSKPAPGPQPEASEPSSPHTACWAEREGHRAGQGHCNPWEGWAVRGTHPARLSTRRTAFLDKQLLW